MASGTTSQRLLQIANMYAASLATSVYGVDSQPNKLGVRVNTTFTGDTLFSSHDAYNFTSTTGQMSRLLTQKAVQNTAATATQRFFTAHG